MNNHRMFFFLIVVSACSDNDATLPGESLGSEDFAVIHGVNDMQNIYQESSQLLRDYSKSVMMVAFKKDVKFDSNNILDTSSNVTFNSQYSICPQDTQFINEIALWPAAIGSASLLSPSIVVTAGHNITEPFKNMSLEQACSNLMFIFDFQKDSSSQTNSQTNVVSKIDDVFYCKKIHRVEFSQINGTLTDRDYAIIELDRPAGRPGIPYDDNPTHSPNLGESVVTIGHPAGLCKKISSGNVGDTIPSSANADYIFTNLDVWKGSSGGPVISRTTGLQWGIVSGDPTNFGIDFPFINGNLCRSVFVDPLNSKVQFNSPLYQALGTTFSTGSKLISTLPAYRATARQIFVGDISGDGRDDVVLTKGPHISSTGLGTVEIALAPALPNNTFSVPLDYSMGFYNSVYSFPAGFISYELIDMNNDRRADLVGFSPNSSNIYVALSNGVEFGLYKTYSNSICYDSQCKFADVNGDGYTDIVAFDRQNQVRVALSKGSVGGFSSSTIWKTNFSCFSQTCDLVPYNPIPGIVNCFNYPTCGVGDFNGDKKADIIRATNGDDLFASRKTEVALSTGASFGVVNNWGNLCGGVRYLNFGASNGRPNPIGFETYLTLGGDCSFKDINDDGMCDVIDKELNPSNGKGSLFVATSTGGPQIGFRMRRQWHSDFCAGTQCVFGDLNGDGRQDALSFYRDSSYDYLWTTWAK